MFGIKLPSNIVSQSTAKLPAAVKLPRRIAPSRARFPDSLPILELAPRTVWDLGSAYEGTLILGATGSGKSSSSGKQIARGFLRRGMGGLVLCAKPSEKDVWLRYARETGRSKSVIVFDGSGHHRLNFLDYSARRAKQFDAHSLVELFGVIMEAARGGEAGGGDNQVWTDLSNQLLTNAIAVLHSAFGRITLDQMVELIESAPTSPEESENPVWRASSFCFRAILKMYHDPVIPLSLHDREAHGNFFRRAWARRDSKVRTSIEATFSSSAYVFQTGYLRELFATTTDVLPEMAGEGIVFIIDLPVKTHGAGGKLAQHIWKYLFQLAIEERKGDRNDSVRPVFIWADECQFFINSRDKHFQGTARSAKACTVYITQNLSAMYGEMKGSKNPRDDVNNLIGSLQTKIFHQNQDIDTNKFASDTVGQHWQWVTNIGSNTGRSSNDGWNKGISDNQGYSVSEGKTSFSGGTGRSNGTSAGMSEQLHNTLLPSVFPSLRKGGGRSPPEMIVLQGGRQFSANGGATWLRCAVPQR